MSRNRGRKKLKLRDLSRLNPSAEEREALIDQLFDVEMPVVTGILGLSLLEHRIDELLIGHFHRRDAVTWEKLTGVGAPLATFSNKIIAAYAFGIFNEAIRDGLDTVRNIRNAFAHSKKLIDFSSEPIPETLRKISLPTKKSGELYYSLLKVRAMASRKDPEAVRYAFVALCLIIDTELIKRQKRRAKAQSRRMTQRYRGTLQQGLLSHLRPADAEDLRLALRLQE